MLAAVLRVAWLELVRDRTALTLTFILPMAFFSIFASVFSAMDPGGLRPVEATVVAPSSPFADRVVDQLQGDARLVLTRHSLDEADIALQAVRRGDTAAVIVLPAEPPAPDASLPGASQSAIILHTDRSNPLASNLVQGLVQAAAARAVAQSALQTWAPGFNVPQAVPVQVVDALGRSGKRPSIAFFAAGLGVMFLMLSAAGRSSILLDERQRGVLGRLLAARVGLSRLLAGRWLFLMALGCVQIACMFLWAALGFGLELFTPYHLSGWTLVTLPTAAATAAFGLMLAALCRTRAQLQGLAVVSVLSLCALGGNLFPSFLMPETLQSIGKWAFNAWALEAYQAVFWYERPLIDLIPQLTALLIIAAVFLAVAVWLAGRWRLEGDHIP